jgi:MFS superfamily sulfate permease-like transporter
MPLTMPVPARVWLRNYNPAWFRADLMAGITLAAYLLPSAIGDASLAGLPPQAKRVPGTTYFADLARHPENTREAGVVVVRSEGALLFSTSIMFANVWRRSPAPTHIRRG